MSKPEREEMNRRNTEIRRVKEFLEQSKSMKKDGFLNDLILTSGIIEMYEDKYRKLLHLEGTNPHPYPEERI